MFGLFIFNVVALIIGAIIVFKLINIATDQIRIQCVKLTKEKKYAICVTQEQI